MASYGRARFDSLYRPVQLSFLGAACRHDGGPRLSADPAPSGSDGGIRRASASRKAGGTSSRWSFDRDHRTGANRLDRGPGGRDTHRPCADPDGCGELGYGQRAPQGRRSNRHAGAHRMAQCHSTGPDVAALSGDRGGRQQFLGAQPRSCGSACSHSSTLRLRPPLAVTRSGGICSGYTLPESWRRSPCWYQCLASCQPGSRWASG